MRASPPRRAVWWSALGAALLSCKGDAPQDSTPSADDSPADDSPADDSSSAGDSAPDDSSAPEALGFTEDIWPLHAQLCADCHGYWGQTAAEAWATLQDPMVKDPPLLVPGDPDSSWYYLVMTTSPPTAERMPYPVEPLSQEQLDRLRAWIVSGAPAEGLWESFGDVYRESGRCMSCHDDWGMNAADLYTTLTTRSSGGYAYIVPGDPEQSLLWLKVAEGTAPYGARMPLRLDPLSEAQLTQVRDWITAGAPLE